MRRVSSLFALIVLAFVAATAAHGATHPESPAAPAFWDPEQIATVVANGILGSSVDDFRADQPLTWGELADALAAWGYPIAAPADPARPVSIRDLDARLVAALGLSPAARAIRVFARDAGLDPIASLGTETVARLVGLRLNHPAAQDELELLPGQPATRAEAAYSFARALTITDAEKQEVLTETSALMVPKLTVWQRKVLTRALRFVGYPYVWTGTSEKATQTLWDGTVVPGGFDCSGFVWRVYKLKPFPHAPKLSRVLQGRTTYDMSGEVPTSLRVPLSRLEPADVVFIGAHGPQSLPTEIDHTGIYLGSGWIVHSSSHGVTLDPMKDWYLTNFAWARRPLAEAGLEKTDTLSASGPSTQ